MFVSFVRDEIVIPNLGEKEGRKLTPQVFAKKYENYKSARMTRKSDAVHEFYLLQQMGIIILPNLLEKIEAGDSDLIPMFAYLSDQKDLKTAEECRTWWDASKKDYEVILDYRTNVQ